MAKELRLITGSKSVRMEDLPPEAWRFITGGSATGSAENLYSTVSILYRCINARADAAASIPFRIENSRGRAIETSDDWKGGNGWLPNPRLLIRQFFMSMDFTNSVYAGKLMNRYRIPKGLQYYVPTTITPKWDDNGELMHFERKAGKVQKEIAPEEMFYMWVQDAFVEVGASPNTPVKAALQAAGVLSALDEFVEEYFEHGAIDPVIGAIPRSTPQEERERAEGVLNNILTGIKNAFQIRLVSSDDVKLTQPLRNGLDSLKNNPITQEKRENVALALGVPLSFLLGNQANYATATQEEKTLIRWGVQPRVEMLFEALDYQLYKPLGVRLKPDFDNLEMFQEEEVQRSAALSSFFDAISKAKTKDQFEAAAAVFGYDLTQEQIGKLYIEPQEPAQPDPVQPDPMPQNQPQDTTANTRAIIEIGRWEKKSINAGKLVTWHTVEIPEDIRRHIIDAQDWRKGMAEAREMLKNVREVKENSGDIKALASALNKLAETPAKKDDMVTIKADNVTVQNDDAVKAMAAMTKAFEDMKAAQQIVVNVPQQPAPSVTVEVPQQPAPVVNITNDVQTPQVNVEVKPADVLIPKPAKKMRIIRDGRGDITGAEAE